jgi:hypothetical protein
MTMDVAAPAPAPATKTKKEDKGTLIDECPICSDDMYSNERIFTLKCKHIYHKKCLFKSLNFLKPGEKMHCPYCRTIISNLPLEPNEMPRKGIHKEYNEIKGLCLSFDKIHKYLSNNDTQCCMLKFSKHNKENKEIQITKNTIQCNRKKKKNSYYCGYHINIDLPTYKFYFV